MKRSPANPWSMWFPCDRSDMPLRGRILSRNLYLTLSGTQTMPRGAHTLECTAGLTRLLTPNKLNSATTRPALETQHQSLQITPCTVWRSQIQVISYLKTVKVMAIDIISAKKCRRIVDLMVSGSSQHLQR